MATRSMQLGVLLATCTAGAAWGQVVGWRGNWTGRFPEAAAPTHWSKVSRIMAGLRCRAGRPRGGAAGTLACCGAVTEWLVLGPLPVAEGSKGIDEEFFPNEAEWLPDEGEKVKGIAWRKLATDANTLDLAAVFGKDARGVAYTHTYIWSEREGTVLFRFLHHKHLKAYVNGKLIYPSKTAPNVKLNGGWNRLLCKVDWAPQTGQYNIYPSLWHLGVCITAVMPFESETKNIVWQSRLPNWSIASPVVAGDRILVMCEPGDLVCLRRSDGKILWVRSNNFYDTLLDGEKKTNPAFKEIAPKAARLKEINDAFSAAQWPAKALLDEKAKLEKAINRLMKKADQKKYGRNWGELHGNSVPTPVCDGKSVYVWLGIGVAARYDLDGNRKWILLETMPIKHHGFNSSPVLVGGKLIVYMRKMIALDAGRGEVLWRMDAAKDDKLYGDNFHDSLLVLRVGNEELVYAHGQIVRPSDGSTLWEDKGWKESASIPTPIVADGWLYHLMASGTLRKARLPGSAGAVSLRNESNFRFFTKGGQSAYTRTFCCASPLYHEGLLYLIDCMGNLKAVDAATQEVVYERDLGLGLEIRSRVHTMGTAYASPILFGKHVLAVGMSGTMVVFEPGRKYKEIARNKIEHVTNPGVWYEKPEGFPSTPVCDGKRLYIRGDEYLYCIGRR